MKRLFLFLACLLLTVTSLFAKVYYVSPDGDDANPGTIDAPFAGLAMAQRMVAAGDTVYLRGGTYRPTEQDLMGFEAKLYHCVFVMDKSGTDEAHRICYFGYPGERPVFDLSDILPAEGRICAFFVKGSYLHFRNFEVVGTHVIYMPGNTQSECFSNRGGSHNIYENLAVHDGEAIGFYILRGSDNLVINCDAYCNFETVTGDKSGGNVDGFGAHPKLGDKGNAFRYCRSWWNSDDGFDLIHAYESVTIDHCWAFFNGYRAGTFESAADGNGIKAGGYGMRAERRAPEGEVPRHRVTNCIAYRNKAGGIYSNHHLGGITFLNNSSFHNRYNYNMVCRKSASEIVDVNGYDHVLKNNLSYQPTEAHVIWLGDDGCTVENNSFAPTELPLTDADFVSLDASQLLQPRLPDGSLPEISLLTPVATSPLSEARIGHCFEAE